METILPKDKITQIVRYIRHSDLYAEEILGIALWSGMRLILDSLYKNQRTSVKACHGISKTTCAAIAVVHFLNNYPGSTVITTAPTFRLVEKLLWAEIRGIYQRDTKNVLIGRALNTEIKTSDPTWAAYGFSTDRQDRAEGIHAPYLLWVLDESKGLPLWLYASIEGSMTGGYSRVLELSTTDGADQQCPFRQHHERYTDRWNCLTLSAMDSPFIGSEDFPEFSQYRNADLYKYGKPRTGREWPIELEAQIQIANKAWIIDRVDEWKGSRDDLLNTKVFGQFGLLGADALIPLKWVMAAVNAPVTLEEPDHFQYGLDVARYGDDQTVLITQQGRSPRLFTVDAWAKVDTMETVNIATEITGSRGAIRVDSIGIGAGVYDRLSEIGHPVIGIEGSAKAMSLEVYVNVRAEMFFNLRELFQRQFEEGNVLSIPDAPELVEELTGLKYIPKPDGRLQIEPKDNFKKRFGRSPDKADALAYCCYEQPAMIADQFEWTPDLVEDRTIDEFGRRR